MPLYAPSMEDLVANNFTCFEQEVNDGIYFNSCPNMQGCYLASPNDANETKRCWCSAIAIADNDSWPDCDKHSDSSWMPILAGGLSTLLGIYNTVFAIWMLSRLLSLKLFTRNAVTEALCWSNLSALAGLVHQACELIGMLILSGDWHMAFYKPGAGIGTLSLTFLGFGAVMTNLSIPLLWIQIASSGMNKGEAATRKAKAEKFVKVMSGIFIFTFVGVAFAAGMGTTGLYSILWLLGFLAAFNVGGRKIRTQLTANDKEGRNTEAVNSIMMYVRSYTFGLFLYIVSIMWFLSASGASEDPHGWWLPALLIYVSLNLLVNFNLRYIYASLKKKLNKGKRGAVADSSTASSSASTNSSSTE